MASPETSSPDWSNLPADVLVSFLERLPVVDHVHFGAVCASWRSAAARCPRLPKPPSPWLLLRSHGPFGERVVRGDEACAFLGFPDGNRYSIRLPNVRYRYCIGSSSNGWLVVVGDDGELCLLNPISGAVFALPRFVRSPDEAGESWYSSKAAVSSGSPPSMGGYTVAMIQIYSDKLAVAGDGDHSWTVLEVPARRLVDVAFHHGRVFVLATDCTVVVCDLAGGTSLLPAVTCAVSRSLEEVVLRQDTVETDYFYLVGSSPGGLLMMLRRSRKTRNCIVKDMYKTQKIEAYVLDDGGEKWRKVESLGGSALFVGDYFSSFWVKGSPEFGRNCVYLSEEGLAHSVGVFDMENGKMEIWRVNSEGKIWWEWSTIWFMPSLI